jgi:hypothetical protein
MTFAAEVVVLLGILAVVGTLIFKGRVPHQKAAIFVGVVLIAGGTAFGGLAWAGIPGAFNFNPQDPPMANSLFTVVFLSSSDTDRTEAGENIEPSGHTIRYELSDSNMDGLGDVTLDVRVTNANVGEVDDTWAFEAKITSVSTSSSGGGGAAAPIVNQTNINTQWAVSWSLTDVGSPTLSANGNVAVSMDWKTGVSDALNIDLEMSPSACDDLAVGTPGTVVFMVGGVVLTLQLTESA